jgi:hypothetical protein
LRIKSEQNAPPLPSTPELSKLNTVIESLFFSAEQAVKRMKKTIIVVFIMFTISAFVIEELESVFNRLDNSVTTPPIEVNHIRIRTAILAEHGSLNPALWGQAVGATRNSVKCP